MGLAADPSDAGYKGAETRRENRAKRRLNAERRKMTLAEALAERAAEDRDTIVEALFAPLLSDDSTVMEKHRAATGILERMLGKTKDPVIVEEKAPVLTWEEEVALLVAQVEAQKQRDMTEKSDAAVEGDQAPPEQLEGRASTRPRGIVEVDKGRFEWRSGD